MTAKIMTSILTDASLLKTRCFINNQWVDADSGKTIEVINPFDQSTIATVPALSATEIQHSITYASSAQQPWAKLTAKHRANLLHKWADLIEYHAEDLARLMTLEQGKPIKESRGEIAYANSYIRWFAEEGKRIYGDLIPATSPNLRHIILKQPIGVCVAITPWNFPSAMITRKVAPALASGCTMIVKPSEETPFSALALAELAQQAGFPAGVLQVVTGDAMEIGQVLTKDERVKKVSFTGSTNTGKLLAKQCADSVKKLSLELGGNAPFIIFDDANLDHAVDGLIASKFRNAGQTCVCANRVFVQKDIKKEFIKRLTQKVNALNLGNGLNEETDISVLINQKAMNKAQHLLSDAINKGATLITGGQVSSLSPLLLTPTILSDINDDMDIAHAEIFSAIVPVFEFTTTSEVITKANDTIHGLASYFYTNDLSRSWQVCEGLEYGMVAQNTGMLSTEVAPFGGIKQSGYGREGSKYGIEEYVVSKYWCQNIENNL